MALNAYLKLKGQKSGQIKGSVIQKGRENTIEVNAYAHEIVSPRDPASGLATGKRMHKPFVITKELDKSSPVLYQAMVTNENISEFELKCFAPNKAAATGAGAETNHFTVKLTNAHISSIRSVMRNNNDVELAKFPVEEEISFTYQKIEWTWVDGGITAQDDWESPVV